MSERRVRPGVAGRKPAASAGERRRFRPFHATGGREVTNAARFSRLSLSYMRASFLVNCHSIFFQFEIISSHR